MPGMMLRGWIFIVFNSFSENSQEFYHSKNAFHSNLFHTKFAAYLKVTTTRTGAGDPLLLTSILTFIRTSNLLELFCQVLTFLLNLRFAENFKF